jgi:MscS family membrane protein
MTLPKVTCVVRHGILRWLAICTALAVFLVFFAPDRLPAQETETQGATSAFSLPDRDLFRPMRTESPRRTVESFLVMRDELSETLTEYRQDRSPENFQHLIDSGRRLESLFDVSGVPHTLRSETAFKTGLVMLEIYDRLDLPSPDDAPAEFDPDLVYVLPDTPFRIVHTDQDARSGEFLFAGDVITAAPRFLRGLGDMPRQTPRPFDDWVGEFRSLTGPFFPAGIEHALPQSLSKVVFDTPLWKIGLFVILLAIPVSVILIIHRLLSRIRHRNKVRKLALRAVTPIVTIMTISFLRPIIDLQLNIFGRMDEAVEIALIVLSYASGAWIVWLLCLLFSESLIARPSMKDKSLDASLMRLSARMFGVVGVIIVMAFGIQDIGLPAFSLLAGLGVGGLAVALAIRPSLENLIAGFILYLDQPARVGDFCQLDDLLGTIENIGVRSTQIRALDRTVHTIPNAQLADMKIVNWAKCDKMLIHHRLGLRYETTPDQLRWVLAKLRQMFHAHPRIETESVRVRFDGYGDSSLDIDIRVYAQTRERNDYFAISEDVLLRAGDIVAKSGSSIAFPSQVVYMARDGGLDDTRTKNAVHQVERWRQSGSLPFPRFAQESIDRIRDRLAYPPHGSPHYTSGNEEGEQLFETSLEPLSAEAPEDDDVCEDNDEEQAKKDSEDTSGKSS